MNKQPKKPRLPKPVRAWAAYGDEKSIHTLTFSKAHTLVSEWRWIPVLITPIAPKKRKASKPRKRKESKK